jgi:hypothetical protein
MAADCDLKNPRDISLTTHKNLRQVRAYQIAAFLHAVRIASRTVAVELLLPFHHVCPAAVFLNQPADAVAAFAGAFAAFDAEHVEFALDVTEDEIRCGARLTIVQFVTAITAKERGSGYTTTRVHDRKGGLYD